MHFAAFRVAFYTLVATAWPACIGDLAVDDVPWACTGDSQCGWRARCIDSVCVLVDSDRDDGTPQDTADTAPDTQPADTHDTTDTQSEETTAPTGFTCDASLASPEPDQAATFDVFWHEGESRWKITVTLDGLTATYALPADVVLPDPTSPSVGPLLECCENPCCPPLP